MSTFKALVVTQDTDGSFAQAVLDRAVTALPPGDLLIRVAYSSLNYKDALSATGVKGVTRSYPHTPGIDAAGAVEKSDSAEFSVGDEVIVIGYDLGMNTPGGFGQYIRIPADWAVRRPSGLSLAESMVLGTAGFTAAMSVERLLNHGLEAQGGPILVTGATGGVGSIAVALLAQLGYQVAAVTGKADRHEFLTSLGAAQVLDRQEVIDEQDRPLLSARWAGAVDTVGGEMLSSAIRATRQWGAVAACGNVASPRLDTTVFPFILRGVTLYGINSEQYPKIERARLWGRLAGEWKLPGLEALAREVPLNQLPDEIDLILKGGQVGRVLVNLG
ncbi:MAG: YhdH/YhfP family quinone oxidoreductase [Anaerolineales bacterium]|nr:YhdH/YhfP family quinone oxidoreductase [Anaerolineales bacterium]